MPIVSIWSIGDEAEPLGRFRTDSRTAEEAVAALSDADAVLTFPQPDGEGTSYIPVRCITYMTVK